MGNPKKPRYFVFRCVKIGTHSGQCVWVERAPQGGWNVGDLLRFKRDFGRGVPVETARIWKIGPPPEYRLFLEL